MDLHNPFKFELVENNLTKNIVNRFQEAISNPRIVVKSLAQLRCFEKPVTKWNAFQIQKTQNNEGVRDTLTGGEIITSKKFRELDPLHIPVNQNPSNGSNNATTNINSLKKGKKIKRIYYYRVGDNDIRLLNAPPPQEWPEPSNVSSEERLQEDESIFCDVCSKTFKNSVDFCLHSIEHNNNEKYHCHICTYNTPSEKKIKWHVQAHERKTHYSCEICKKGFTTRGQAVTHQNVHTGEKPFVCDICGKNFGSVAIFSHHRRDKHWKQLGLTPSSYDCKNCDKKYTTAQGLHFHFRRHHVQGFDESELCDICGKRLSCKKHLKYHRRIHTGYKPNACNLCTKSFAKKEQLVQHLRVHSGEKPFKCKHCSKCFTQRSSRKIHERTHTGERPYICRLCHKGFISKSVLDLHMKKCDGVASDLDKQ